VNKNATEKPKRNKIEEKSTYCSISGRDRPSPGTKSVTKSRFVEGVGNKFLGGVTVARCLCLLHSDKNHDRKQQFLQKVRSY